MTTNQSSGDCQWKSHPFLRGMGEGQLALLAECAMPVTFKPGDLIFREGDGANRFYLLCEGPVLLESETEERAPLVVDGLFGGSVLGWSWLFPPYVWHFTARAVEPTNAVFFYGTWLREAAEKDHTLGYELTKRMAQVVIERLQSTRRRLELETRR
jgi:CRP-like cAMP-binding protein